MATVEGQVTRITFHNSENGYTIAQITTGGEGAEESAEAVSVVGTMPAISAGEQVRLEGDWERHPKYGRQFKVASCSTQYPSTVEGIRKYLASGLIKGIGPVTAARIVDHFGSESLRVIDEEPKRLTEVQGLGRKRAGMIARAWSQQREMKDVMVFLQSHGVGTASGVKIFEKYKGEGIAVVQANPFRLERDIPGIGFQTADRIAANLGLAADSPERVQAAVRYLLSKAADDGHVFLPEQEILARGVDLLQVRPELFASALDELHREESIVTEQARHYLPYLHAAEAGVARSLRRLRKEEGASLAGARDADSHGIRLSAGQLRAVAAAASEKVLLVTGGPGTGKTTVTRSILNLLEKNDLEVKLCSPTGRAAKRLEEATGREARTIHRLLEFIPSEGSFRRGHKIPLDTDAVIVDEVSMVDVVLMNALLRAVPAHARVVLVGDADQLPSVGPGNVIRDIMTSGGIPVVRLTEIYRQDRESQIVLSAHRINGGDWPLVDNREDGDFFFLEEDEPEKVADLVVDLCARRLPAHGGYDPVRDIQVLTSMYRGETGADDLNRRLQSRLNSASRPHRQGEREFRQGDKVMQVRNNYDKGVFNGDLGRILYFDTDEERMTVEFGSGVTGEYEGTRELDDLALAYAISIHRSQGSEFPVVVLPLTTQHYVMLQRNLLYTAITRARRLMVVVGSRRAMTRAIHNNAVAERFTTLSERLSDP